MVEGLVDETFNVVEYQVNMKATT